MEEYESARPLRNNKTRTTIETYSPERMERMKQILEMSADDGEPQYYSIHVDGMLVVKKTTDTDRFDNYMTFVDHQTKCVELRTYFGESPNCNTYRMLISGAAASPLQGAPQLGAVEITEKINEAVTRERMLNKIEGLEKEVTRLEDENAILRKKLRKYKKLDEENRANSDKGSTDFWTKGIELFGPVIAANFGVPGAAPVDGLPPSAATPPPVEVEVEREQTEVDKHFEALKNEYTEKEIWRAMEVVQLLAEHPDLQAELQKVITNKFKEHE